MKICVQLFKTEEQKKASLTLLDVIFRAYLIFACAGRGRFLPRLSSSSALCFSACCRDRRSRMTADSSHLRRASFPGSVQKMLLQEPRTPQVLWGGSEALCTPKPLPQRQLYRQLLLLRGTHPGLQPENTHSVRCSLRSC